MSIGMCKTKVLIVIPCISRSIFTVTDIFSVKYCHDLESQRSFEVIWKWRRSIYDSLLVCHFKYNSISYRFRAIWRRSISTLGVTQGHWIQYHSKAWVMGIRSTFAFHSNFDRIFSRFDTIREMTAKQPPMQPATAWQQRPRLCIASRGKTLLTCQVEDRFCRHRTTGIQPICQRRCVKLCHWW